MIPANLQSKLMVVKPGYPINLKNACMALNWGESSTELGMAEFNVF